MRRIFGITLGLAAMVLLAGCDKGKGEYKNTAELKKAPAAQGGHDHHDHGAKGPHGGGIVELGDEEYHAEVVLDHDTHAIQVYVLGKDAKTASPVAATELSIKPEGKDAVTLKAVAQEGDGEGKASKFELIDDKLVHDILDAKFLHGDLKITIGDKPYSGHIDMHMDGDEHKDHKDGDHKDEPKADAKPDAAKGDGAKSEEAKPADGEKKEEPAKTDGDSK